MTVNPAAHVPRKYMSMWMGSKRGPGKPWTVGLCRCVVRWGRVCDASPACDPVLHCGQEPRVHDRTETQRWPLGPVRGACQGVRGTVGRQAHVSPAKEGSLVLQANLYGRQPDYAGRCASLVRFPGRVAAL